MRETCEVMRVREPRVRETGTRRILTSTGQRQLKENPGDRIRSPRTKEVRLRLKWTTANNSRWLSSPSSDIDVRLTL